MQHTKASSSLIHSFGYDPIEQQLQLRFNCSGKDACGGKGKNAEGHECGKCSGMGHKGTYSYSGVPAQTYGLFRDAESTGSAFGTLIKGKFPHTFTPAR